MRRLFLFRVLQIPAFRVPGFTDSGISCSGFYRFRLFVFRVLQIPAFLVPGFTDSAFSRSGFYRFRLFSFRVLQIPAFRVPAFLVTRGGPLHSGKEQLCLKLAAELVGAAAGPLVPRDTKLFSRCFPSRFFAKAALGGLVSIVANGDCTISERRMIII